MKNNHGLDDRYFRVNLEIMVRDVTTYTPDEMFRTLSTLMMVAAHQANLKVKLDVFHKVV